MFQRKGIATTLQIRLRTGSVYPCMVLHGIFNGAALLAAVTIGGGT